MSTVFRCVLFCVRKEDIFEAELRMSLLPDTWDFTGCLRIGRMKKNIVIQYDEMFGQNS